MHIHIRVYLSYENARGCRQRRMCNCAPFLQSLLFFLYIPAENFTEIKNNKKQDEKKRYSSKMKK